MVKFQVVLSLQCLLLPLILTISFFLNFQNTAYPWRLLLRSFSGRVCSECQSCASLWGTPACPVHLAGAVPIAWACCPPGVSSESASWSCQSSRPLWTLSDADSLNLFRGETTGSSQLAFCSGSESTELSYIHLCFSLCILHKHASHPSLVTASEELPLLPDPAKILILVHRRQLSSVSPVFCILKYRI